MHRLRSHLIGIAQGAELLFSDFEEGGEMWTGEGPRESRRTVRFDQPFRLPPAVHLGLGLWDADGQTNQRADLRAEAVTTDGFEIVFRTWGDSRVARVRADWLAVGELAGDEDWDIA